jgi:hypothetical protein
VGVGSQQKALHLSARGALAGEAGVEYGYVVAEYAGADGEELGKFVKTMVRSFSGLSTIDEQARFVALVGGCLGDLVRWEFVVKFGGEHREDRKSASTRSSQSRYSFIFD